jgi:putative membrane protein
VAFIRFPHVSSGLSAVLSITLALLIGFRINQSYDRWWEARKLWGTLVNVSRNLAVKIRELQRPDLADRQVARNVIVAFCVGLKDHLRDEPDLNKLPGFEAVKATPHHMPSFIVRRLYEMFEKWKIEGQLSDERLWVLDAEARLLLDVCGACERIKNTLMSISWRSFTWHCIIVLLLVLPWGLVDDFGVLTIPMTILYSYFVIAGEFIAQIVEAPFGRQEDNLDLEGICRNIDRSVSEILIDNHQD